MRAARAAAFPSCWRATSPPRPRRCAGSSSTSRRVSRRRSTGPRRWRRSGATRLDEARGRRDPRHDPQVPRGPGTGAGARSRRSRSHGGGARCLSGSLDRRAGADRGRVRTRAAAVGRRGAGRRDAHVRRSARMRRSRDRARRVLGGAGDAGEPARGHRGVRPRVRGRSGTGATRAGSTLIELPPEEVIVALDVPGADEPGARRRRRGASTRRSSRCAGARARSCATATSRCTRRRSSSRRAG